MATFIPWQSCLLAQGKFTCFSLPFILITVLWGRPGWESARPHSAFHSAGETWTQMFQVLSKALWFFTLPWISFMATAVRKCFLCVGLPAPQLCSPKSSEKYHTAGKNWVWLTSTIINWQGCSIHIKILHMPPNDQSYFPCQMHYRTKENLSDTALRRLSLVSPFIVIK